MISILCTSYLYPDAPSGVNTYIRNLKKYMTGNQDARITFVTPKDAPAVWTRIAGLARIILTLFSFGNNNLIELSFEVKNRILIYGALQKFRKQHFDLINAQDILSGHVAKFFFGNRIPLALTCHFNDTPVEEDILKYGLKESRRPYLVKRYTRKFSRVDQFIFVAAYTRRKTTYLLPAHAVTKVIYNGLDFSSSVPRANNGPVFYILNTGHVEERKNQKMFIPFAKELINNDFREFRIHIVGDGPALEDLRELVSSEGLDPYFDFAGWSNNIAPYLAMADLYIHTSLNDICPYSVTEAIAAKIPALAFRVGGLPEMLDDEYLFKANDTSAMAAFLDKHADRLPIIANEQYDRIRKDFSSQRQIESLMNIYREMTGRPVFNMKKHASAGVK